MLNNGETVGRHCRSKSIRGSYHYIFSVAIGAYVRNLDFCPHDLCVRLLSGGLLLR